MFIQIIYSVFHYDIFNLLYKITSFIAKFNMLKLSFDSSKLSNNKNMTYFFNEYFVYNITYVLYFYIRFRKVKKIIQLFGNHFDISII